MITINLVNQNKGDIKYQISKFPDGQQNITLNSKWETMRFGENNPKYVEVEPRNFKNIPIQIIARLRNWLDLELIVCTVACLKELGIEEIHLVTPYFVGARSDRKFEEGGNWYLKQVICPIINSLNLASITVMDAHSYVLGNLLNNFKAIDNENLVSHFAIPEIIKGMNLPSVETDIFHTTPKNLHYDKRGFDNLILISPDAGASHKIQKIADKIGYKGDIITCTKERGADGKLTQTNVPLGYDFKSLENKDFIIIDDICDGGRTFINIAKKIKEYAALKQFNEGNIYLIVTHGIFSAGFEELSKYFDGIYCTNSYSDIGDLSGNNLTKTNVKQLNVY